MRASARERRQPMNVGETERIFLRHSSGSPIDCKWKLRLAAWRRVRRRADGARHASDFGRARARLWALRAAGGTPVPTSPVAHPLGPRSAAVLKRAEVAEDGVGCHFRLVGSLR